MDQDPRLMVSVCGEFTGKPFQFTPQEVEESVWYYDTHAYDEYDEYDVFVDDQS